MKQSYFYLLMLFGFLGATNQLLGQEKNTADLGINHVEYRKTTSLDGLWNVRFAPFNDTGNAKLSNTMSPEVEDPNFMDRLLVPKDWNTQNDKLYYFEGAVFYKKNFELNKAPNKRYFIHFGAANYEAEVYLNGLDIGKHIGGFTPFSFDVTHALKQGDNTLVVRVSNLRKKEAIPTIRFDWWNYGGLTRSVKLVAVPNTFIQDYSVQLNPENVQEITGWVQLEGDNKNRQISLSIPELKIKTQLNTDENGKATFSLRSKKIVYWSPENPKQYKVEISAGEDTVSENIGFKNH